MIYCKICNLGESFFEFKEINNGKSNYYRRNT